MIRASCLLYFSLISTLFGAQLVFGIAQAQQQLLGQEQVKEKENLISDSDVEVFDAAEDVVVGSSAIASINLW